MLVMKLKQAPPLPLPPLELEPQASDEPSLWSLSNPNPSIFEWRRTGYWRSRCDILRTNHMRSEQPPLSFAVKRRKTED